MDNSKLSDADHENKTEPVRATADFASVKLAEPKKPSRAALIILVILLVISLVAGGVFAYLYFSNTAQNITDAPVSTSENNVTDENEKEAEDNLDIVSLAQAEDLLKNKYELNPLETVFIDGWPKYIKNLDQANKILFTVYQTQRDGKYGSEQYIADESVVVRKIAFDDFNDAYVYYFGTSEPLEKKEYQLDSMISRVVYSPEDDSFDVYFPDGIGGYSTTRMLSKVDNVVGTKDGFKATVLAVTLDSVVRQNVEESLGRSGDGESWFYEIPMNDETLNKIRDSLSVYEFNFVDEDGEYRLVSIERI